MELKQISRRTVIKGSVSTIALGSLPGGVAHGQTIRVRPDWQTFRTSANYPQYVNAIRAMRANTNANDRSSWSHWINAHQNFCPHDIAYFLAWHRGFLYYFEQQLRLITGNSTFMLPYWNYYSAPNMPAEFTNPAGGNPLFVNRVNTNVYNALSLGPFPLTNFQRGTLDAFETSLEPRPHGQVHNIIGGAMASLQSPADPIFWLHHGNIDRLCHAWVLSGGKRYPGPSDAYWNGVFTYSSTLTIPRRSVYNPAYLGYTYQDSTLPTSIPPQAGSGGRLMRASMEDTRRPFSLLAALDGPPARPPTVAFPSSEPGETEDDTRSVGGVRNLVLDERSVSARVPVEEEDVGALQSLGGSVAASPFGRAREDGGYRSVQVVLNNVRVTPAGQYGGYYYEVFLNLPLNRNPANNPERYLVGSFGAFEVSTALHHGSPVRLVFPATQLLQNMSTEQIRQLTVSFVRVNGESAASGPAIVVGEMRVELSNREVE